MSETQHCYFQWDRAHHIQSGTRSAKVGLDDLLDANILPNRELAKAHALWLLLRCVARCLAVWCLLLVVRCCVFVYVVLAALVFMRLCVVLVALVFSVCVCVCVCCAERTYVS